MTPQHDSAYRRAVDYACFAVVILVFAGAMVRRARRPVPIESALPPERSLDLQAEAGAADRSAGAITRDDVALRIDPNSASWWELAELPGIGETKARAIIAYREQFRRDAVSEDPDTVPPPAFIRAEDLDHVKGIGPATVEKLRPLLHFAIDRTRDSGAPVPP